MGWFILAIVNNAAMNVGVHLSFKIHGFFLRYILKNGSTTSLFVNRHPKYKQIGFNNQKIQNGWMD